MNYTKDEYIDIGDIWSAYSLFNSLTGLNIEFEPDQSYGTDCWGRCKMVEKFDDYVVETVKKIEDMKTFNKEAGVRVPWFLHISEHDVIAYLIHVGEIPKANVLFEISY